MIEDETLEGGRHIQNTGNNFLELTKSNDNEQFSFFYLKRKFLKF